MKTRFQFGNIVVAEDDQIGVIVKTWHKLIRFKTEYIYDVYVRSYNGIKEYKEENINHFVYSKELAQDELDFY